MTLTLQEILAVAAIVVTIATQTVILLIKAGRLEQYAKDHLDRLDQMVLKLETRITKHEALPQHGNVPYVSQPVCDALHKHTEDRINGLFDVVREGFAHIEQRLDRIEGNR